MKLNKQFWDDRYTSDQTGWDVGSITTPLKEYIDQLSDKSIRILIPGCGNSYEAEYLFNKGFKNVFIADYAQTALDNFSKRVPDFPKDNLICDDFFNINDSYDLILEQTFFCAIDKNKRAAYAKQVHKLLSPKGKLVGLLFNAPLNEDHPPYGGNKEEYITYFEPYFEFKVFDKASNSITERDGRELFILFNKK